MWVVLDSGRFFDIQSRQSSPIITTVITNSAREKHAVTNSMSISPPCQHPCQVHTRVASLIQRVHRQEPPYQYAPMPASLSGTYEGCSLILKCEHTHTLPYQYACNYPLRGPSIYYISSFSLSALPFIPPFYSLHHQFFSVGPSFHSTY